MSSDSRPNVYITSAGAYLPGPPIDNDNIESVLGLVAGKESRLKRRILKSNGIRTRHYAIDKEQRTTMLNEELAARAVLNAVERRGARMSDVEMLAVGTTIGDMPVPGFASMVHGRLASLDAATGPMDVLSAGGVCASGMAAMKAAWLSVAGGRQKMAVACGSELVSRMLKASRFGSETDLDVSEEEAPKGTFRQFDADFLRWMLSDGAGAVLLEDKPAPTGLSLRVEWVHLASYAHEFEPCMYSGVVQKKDPKAGETWLDYPTIALAEARGVTMVRQDTRILPAIVKLGTEEYIRLIREEKLSVDSLDHVLCHYSSNFFRGEIFKMLTEAGVMPPEHKWFSNLESRGNTGAASIYLMLEEALETGRFSAGEKVLLMVPESGRFSVAFALLTVVTPDDDVTSASNDQSREASAALEGATTSARAPVRRQSAIATTPRLATARASEAVASAVAKSPLGAPAPDADALVKWLMEELALVWADFDRMLRHVPLIQRLDDGTVQLEDYKRLLVNLRQQVMEGARWIARAASSISIEMFPLRSMFIGHAGEEHRDFQMLERDFVAVGGTLEEIQSAPKNIGSEALSSFMFHHASQPDPVDLLGAMFVIEGLGAGKANHWGEQLCTHLGLEKKQVSFLHYHGANDDDHFEKLRETIRSGFVDRKGAEAIVKTAKCVARLYALQLEEIDHV